MIEKYIKQLSDLAKQTDRDEAQLFFRGQSVGFRSPTASAYKGNPFSEKDAYLDAIIHHPETFRGLTYFEQLLTMQHYENNTRLMDVTTNFLIAMLFACFSSNDANAEILVYRVQKDEILFPSSDKLLMLSALAHFSNQEQEEIKRFCQNHKGTIPESLMRQNGTLRRFLHELRNERPAFEAEIVGADLLNSYFVTTYDLNPRVTRQSGGFVIMGLNKDPRDDAKIRTIPVPRSDFSEIIQDLRLLGVDEHMMKPEIEHLYYSRENDAMKAQLRGRFY